MLIDFGSYSGSVIKGMYHITEKENGEHHAFKS